MAQLSKSYQSKDAAVEWPGIKEAARRLKRGIFGSFVVYCAVKSGIAEGTASFLSEQVRIAVPSEAPPQKPWQANLALSPRNEQAIVGQLSPEKGAKVDGLKLAQDQKNALKEFIPVAMAVRAEGKPINPTVLVAQFGLESGFGRAMPHYNFGGVKAGSWKGATYEAQTTEMINGKYIKVVDKFRAYNNLKEAAVDYSDVIGSQPWFKDSAAHADNWLLYLEGLQNGPPSQRYATADNYVQKISELIEEYRLVELTS